MSPFSNIIILLLYLGIYFLAIQLVMKKLDVRVELVKLIYSVACSVIFVLIFVFVLDVICYLVSGGWVNPEDGRPIGSWPIVSGTIRSSVYSPASHVIGILFGFGMMARIMIGKRTPVLLKFLDEK